MTSTSDREEWERIVNEDLQELLALVEETGIEELEVSAGDRSIRIKIDRTARPTGDPDEGGPETADDGEPSLPTISVHADRVGTFYRSPQGEDEPLKDEDDSVAQGESIGFIDSLNVWHEIAVPEAGRILSFAVSDGTDVEYGQVLALIQVEERDSGEED